MVEGAECDALPATGDVTAAGVTSERRHGWPKVTFFPFLFPRDPPGWVPGEGKGEGRESSGGGGRKGEINSRRAVDEVRGETRDGSDHRKTFYNIFFRARPSDTCGTCHTAACSRPLTLTPPG